LIQAQEYIASNPNEAAAQVARFLRQDRAFIAELMTKVEYKMNLTPDSVGNIQLAIDQLRGMNRLSKEVTPAEVIWKEPLAAAAAGRVQI
jgi:hypothetical protein